MVVIPIHKGNYYIIPQHEFNRYWLPHVDFENIPNLKNYIDFSKIPRVSKMAGLKRGKGFKRVKEAYDRKPPKQHIDERFNDRGEETENYLH
jgi:hypothetical protein